LDTESIIAELEAERDRLNDAIAALQGARRVGRGRPRAAAGNGRRVRRHLSAAARRKIAEAAKRRWAKAKAAGRNSLSAKSLAGEDVLVNGAFAYRVRRIGRARRWKVKKRTGLPETWLTQRRLGLAVKEAGEFAVSWKWLGCLNATHVFRFHSLFVSG
jgi:hypothetical protein